jgi:hypothetical protein
MNDPSERDQLLDLFSAVADGTITAGQHAELERMLTADPQARQLYFDYMDVHFGLHQWRMRDDEVSPLARLAEQMSAAAAPRPAAAPSQLRYAGVIAATLCVSIVFQWILFPRTANQQDAYQQRAEYVATLARTADCVWEHDDVNWRAGWRLLPGEMRLARGVAEIRFDSGSELIIEGPAVVRIESVTAATVLRGKVVLSADETSEAFALRTPSSTLVDYGTEYAVSVGDSGEEVHVFDGQVQRCSNGGKPARPVSEFLAAGEAKGYGRRPGTPGKAVPLGDGRFVRQVPDSAGPAADPADNLLVYEGFDYQAAADLTPERLDGGFGWTDPWAASESVLPGALNLEQGLRRPDAALLAVDGCIDWTAGAVHRKLATPLRLDTNSVYYLSFLFQRDNESPKKYLALTLRNPKDAGPNQRLVMGVAGSNVVFAQFEGGGARTALPLDYEKPYLVVAKIVAGRDRPDQVFLRVYRPDERVGRREPGSWTVVSRPVRSNLKLNTLTISAAGDSRQMVDELRIGTTWSSVTFPWNGL